MAQELEKQPAKSEPLETYKRSYSAAWEKGFLELMFLMAEQYSMELSIKIEGTDKTIPSPTVKFWRESLKDLSPNEMREALRNYMAGERGSFKPNPEELKACVPEGVGTDKPRLQINPDCKDCSGTGWRPVPGKFNMRTRCHCPKVVYAGQEYPFPSPRKQLPPAPRTSEEENQAAAETFGRLRADPEIGRLVGKLAGHTSAAAKEAPEETDEELARRRQKLLNDLAEHNKRRGEQEILGRAK